MKTGSFAIDSRMKNDQYDRVQVMQGDQEKEPVQPGEDSDTRENKGIMPERDENSDLKLDRYGLPLVPQPTDRKDDPLVSQSLALGAQQCHVSLSICLR